MDRFPSVPNGKIEKLPQLLSEVEAIEEGGVVFRNRKDIDKFVEFPLVDACRALYDKNIQTWQSSANKQNLVMGEVNINLDYESLSEENKLIAEEIGERWKYDTMDLVSLKVPVSENTTISEIQTKMGALVDKFRPQPPVWIEARTVDDFSAIHGTTLTEQDLIDWPEEEGGWYFDEKSHLFYPSEEQFKKVTEYQDRREG